MRWNYTSIRKVRIVETIDQTGDITDIVSRLRHWRGIHLAHGGRLYEEAADEIERLRLTNDERAAIALAIAFLQPVGNYDSLAQDTLRKLLERTA